MNRVQLFTSDDSSREGFNFYCTACGRPHSVYTKGSGVPVWQFDGSLDSPTISPSVRVRTPDPYDPSRVLALCHLFLRNGQLQYLSDCTHEYAGKTIDLEPLPDDWI